MTHQNSNIQTTGRVSGDALSMLTRGQVVLHSDGKDFGVVWTKHGPISKGKGDGELAGIEDVTVRVDGSEVDVVGIDPVGGALVLKNTVSEESEVEIDYSYLDNPSLDLKSMSEESNTFGSNRFQGNRFPYDSYFSDSPNQNRLQPKQFEYSYTAWEQKYTTTFNDPTTSLFNQQVHSSSLPPLSYDLERVKLEFEGQEHPTEREAWSYKGASLSSSPEIREGTYVVKDDIPATSNIEGKSSYFYSNQEFEYPTITTLNYRFKTFSLDQIDGNFTGIGAGWATNDGLILAAYLQENGKNYVGILTKKGDESKFSSYKGLNGKVSSDDDKILIVDEKLDLKEDDEIRANGVVVSVEEVNGKEITVNSNPNAKKGENIEVFPVLEIDQLTSYRLSENEKGEIELQTGLKNVVAKTKRENLPSSVEIFHGLESNQFFFGSISRKAKNESGWDFFRATSIPTREKIQGRGVTVQDRFGVSLPEEKPDSWIVSDDQGFWSLTEDEELLTEQSTPKSKGLLGFHRIEPLLQSRAVVDFSTRVKVESWASGFPAHMSFADERKEVTIGFFAEEPSNQPTVSTGYSGVESFQEAGWSETNSSSVKESFIDHYVNLYYDSSNPYSAQNVKDVSPDFSSSPEDYLFSLRTRINDYSLNSNDQTPLFVGVDNGNRQAGIRFSKNGLQFVDKSGNNLFNYEVKNKKWKDGNFHTYRLAVFSGNVSLFVDDEYQTSEALSNFPNGTRNQEEFELFFKAEDQNLDIDVDYFFSHDQNYSAASDRKVGIFTGGDLSDSDSYQFESFDWLNNFLKIRINHDQSTGTKVYLDGSTSEDIQVPYEQLPNRGEREWLNTELGFVEFGSLEPESFARIKWDGVGYSLENVRENQDSLQTSRFNRAEPATSPEPLFDEDPERVLFVSSTKRKVELSQRNYNVRNVLQVESEDGSKTYDFSFNKELDIVTIENTDLPKEHTSLYITFYTEEPHTEDYIRQQEPSTVLYEDTPYFPESARKQTEKGTVWKTRFNSKDDSFNKDDDSWFSDTRQEITYNITSEWCPFFEDLDVIKKETEGEKSLLSPAYDRETFHRFDVGKYEDIYSIPDPKNPGLRKDFRVFELDHSDVSLEDEDWVLDGLYTTENESEARARIVQQENETYEKIEDKALDGSLEDYDGSFLLDAKAYNLDDTSGEDGYGELDVYSSTSVIIDYNSTVNWP